MSLVGCGGSGGGTEKTSRFAGAYEGSMGNQPIQHVKISKDGTLTGTPNEYYYIKGQIQEDGTFRGIQTTTQVSAATGTFELSDDGTTLSGEVKFDQGATAFGFLLTRVP